MAVNIVTGSMLKGLRGAGCRITTICKCNGAFATYYSALLIDFAAIIFFSIAELDPTPDAKVQGWASGRQ